ncbi:hypothetical protein F5Y16DRAFT_383484 [Xylariaceae sp. FL0255]|nr:hypothetical protein F5Y16DRAFT_383484 [Xylariaceae sp. FL0255]
MSKIEKMSIEGVRSFSPLGRQNIAFFTPLTLIVGCNGSGKTTIIECLKYATTGELPPNSKGGAFIHDPKLCNTSSVKAQVRLRFKAPPNNTYTITRNVELSVKKTTRSMKTLDSTLKIENEQGDPPEIRSSKGGDINADISDFLGASPAVLDAVIFCHQEESLWPMSEPGSLKKRFDEIFEAMKYTKAIDNLKTVRKKRRDKLGQLVILADNYKKDKESADKNVKLRLKLETEIISLNDDAEELTRARDEAERQCNQRNESAESFRGIMNDLKMKKEELRLRKETLEASKTRMDEQLDDSDESLLDALTQYEELVAQFEQDLQNNEAQDAEYRHDLDDSRHHLDEKLADKGKHQSDKEKYERQIEAQVDLVQQAAQLHNIRGFDGELDDQKIHAFYDRIQRLHKDKAQDLELLKDEHQRDFKNRTTRITELEGQKTMYTQNRNSARQRIEGCEKTVTLRQSELNKLDADEGARAILASKSQDLEARLQQARQNLQTADFDGKLQTENERLQDFENESSRLNRELKEASQVDDDRIRLEGRKQEHQEKTKKLATLKTTWNDKLSSLVDREWNTSNIEAKFNEGQQTKKRAYEEASRRRDDTLQELKLVQAKLGDLREEAKQRDAEIMRCANAVVNALKKVDPDDPDAHWSVTALPGEIEHTENSIVDLKKEIALVEKLGEYYADCEKVMNEKNKCNLCDRPFVHTSEKSRLAAKIKKSLDAVAKGELQTELEENEQLLAALIGARPQSDTHNRLVLEKKKADKEQHQTKEKADTLVRRVEEMDDDVRAKEETLQDFESISKTVLDISRYHKDIEEADAQIERILSQQQSTGTVRSIADINDQQDQCLEKIRATKTKIGTLSSDKSRLRDTISGLELDSSELRNKVSHVERQLERKKEIQNHIQDQKNEIMKSREAVQQADKDLESIDPEITKAYTIREDFAERGREKEKKVDKDRESLWNSVSELKKINADIQAYINGGGPANLKANEQAVEKLNQTIKRIQEKIDTLSSRSEKMKKEIASNDGKKRNIEENLTHRKAARDAENLNREIRALESRRAHEDFDRLVAEARAFENEKNLKNAEISGIFGTIKSKDEELKRQEKEWDGELKYAAQNYRKAHIEVETTKAAIEDLARYGQALNHAIMQFHTLKMEEVNRIAGELWQSTYQGTDIDTILIRSDSAVSGERSTYNYRVCMVKQDTEMDMRGRCSAGQKVLASIIIRLALAESFGIGCGLIALDEPTTNLDAENIKSLAESLHSIIKARRSQSNFQLIVITHDELFLRNMGCSDFCDDFWRVSRDERQCTRIDRESISTLVT